MSRVEKTRNNEIRQLIISGMAREKLIALIKRRDSLYDREEFANYTDAQLRKIAKEVDLKAQEQRRKKCRV